MNTLSLLQVALRGGIAAAALGLLSLAPAKAATPKALQFISDAGNTSGSTMTLDHPLLNGKGKLNPILTQRWTAVYNDHPVGVQYNESTGRWQIRNEDFAAIPVGARFNVLIPSVSKRIHASPASSYYNVTTFAFQKNKPAALLLATHMVNPVKGFPGTELDKNIGIYYTGAGSSLYNNKWSVYNEDSSNALVAGYNIADVTKVKVGGVPNSFIFTTDAGNITGNYAVINNALTNSNPNAVVFVTHLYSDASSTYLDKPVGVWYFGTTWRIFTQDETAMPTNRAFVVSVYPPLAP